MEHDNSSSSTRSEHFVLTYLYSQKDNIKSVLNF